MRKVCFELTSLAFPIRLTKTGKDCYRLEYGTEIYKGRYEYVGRQLGLSIMHALQHEGRLDNA